MTVGNWLPTRESSNDPFCFPVALLVSRSLLSAFLSPSCSWEEAGETEACKVLACSSTPILPTAASPPWISREPAASSSSPLSPCCLRRGSQSQSVLRLREAVIWALTRNYWTLGALPSESGLVDGPGPRQPPPRCECHLCSTNEWTHTRARRLGAGGNTANSENQQQISKRSRKY